MANLILHVGPGKCGSTSIQGFFATQEKPCVQNTHYILLNPSEIDEMDTEKPSESIVAIFTQLLSDNLIGCDVLLFSHEYLFLCPYSVKNICALAQSLTTKVFIIGYSRRQSDLLISGYSQWLFRLPGRIKETTDILKELGLDPVLFSGLERELIASIINDFYSTHFYRFYSTLNWHISYQKIFQLVHGLGATVKCGVLPNREAKLSLIEDFCEKSEVTLRHGMDAVSRQVLNLSFNKILLKQLIMPLILVLICQVLMKAMKSLVFFLQK